MSLLKTSPPDREQPVMVCERLLHQLNQRLPSFCCVCLALLQMCDMGIVAQIPKIKPGGLWCAHAVTKSEHLTSFSPSSKPKPPLHVSCSWWKVDVLADWVTLIQICFTSFSSALEIQIDVCGLFHILFLALFCYNGVMFTCRYVDVLQVMHLQREELNRETVYLMHPSSIHGVEDMSTLAELHEAAIMHNLFLRYKKDNIYVSVCTYKIALETAKKLKHFCFSWAQRAARLHQIHLGLGCFVI